DRLRPARSGADHRRARGRGRRLVVHGEAPRRRPGAGRKKAWRGGRRGGDRRRPGRPCGAHLGGGRRALPPPGCPQILRRAARLRHGRTGAPDRAIRPGRKSGAPQVTL
ncbi:MAG: Phosphoribosyl-ATP pyrophosphatase, partial [uncultured Microvirga sp.]